MGSAGLFEARVAPERNRLYLTVRGVFRGSDTASFLAELDRAAAALRPGFDVVTDLSRFRLASPTLVATIRRGGELLLRRGRRRAVRVTAGGGVGLAQFQRLINGVFSADSIRYASSVEEADRILDEWPGEG